MVTESLINEKKIFEVLFESEGFVAVDKPAGYLSVPSRFAKQDPRPCVGTLLGKQIRSRLYPIHRLDFEVSGVLLFAKNPRAQKIANQWFEHRTVHKIYQALCPHISDEIGSIFDENDSKPLTWTSCLVKGKKRAFEAPYGKDALTVAQPQKLVEYQSHKVEVFQLTPITGRSHQLRFECYKHARPIVGDILYGSKIPWHPNQIALRCLELDFSECRNASELATTKISASELFG